MFTVNDIRNEMTRLDQLSGLDTSAIPIRVSTRMTKRWGHCAAIKSSGRYRVKELAFADRLLRYATPEHILETVRHEYAHAYVFMENQRNDGHGFYWRRAAVKFGAPPERCSKKPEVSENMPEHENKTKYILSCSKCSWNFKYTREGKAVKAFKTNPECKSYRCPICGDKQLKLTCRRGEQ